MKRLLAGLGISGLLVRAVFVATLLAPAVCYGDADMIYKENNEAVVVVVGIDEEGKVMTQGSGFVVREDGAVVTNYHVVSKAADVKVKAGHRVLDVEGFLHVDMEDDLVILKIPGKDLPTVRVGDAESMVVGEKVYVISSPQGLENTISDGILSGIRKISATRKILQITAPISPGSSGGPVFNKNGEAVGVATFLIEAAQNINFAVPVSLIKDKIANRKLIARQEACSMDYLQTADCWFYLGVAYGTSGMADKAINAFKQAITIKPDLAEAYYDLGVAYGKAGRYQEALEAFGKAVKLKPENSDAHISLGVAYDKLGRYQEAVDALKTAIKVDATNEQAQYNLGVSYSHLGKYDEAVEALNRALSIKPDYADAYGFLGDLYSDRGTYPEAVVAFKQAIRLQPDEPRTHFGLGLAYIALKETSAAFEEYRILKQLDPKAAGNLINVMYR